jgi:hypothetical protein
MGSFRFGSKFWNMKTRTKPRECYPWLIMGILIFILNQTYAWASTIEVNSSMPLSMAEYHPELVGQVQFSISSSLFTVANGDNVKVRLMFENGEAFQNIFDPLSTSLGVQGFLVTSSLHPTQFLAEYDFTFTFLDNTGAPIVSASPDRLLRSGGDMHGDVTVLMAPSMNVGGLEINFSNILNSGDGGLPAEFEGARFLVHDALLGTPFVDSGIPIESIPEPSIIILFFIGLTLIWVTKQKHTFSISRK